VCGFVGSSESVQRRVLTAQKPAHHTNSMVAEGVR
jgi:hypothetical protein